MARLELAPDDHSLGRAIGNPEIPFERQEPGEHGESSIDLFRRAKIVERYRYRTLDLQLPTKKMMTASASITGALACARVWTYDLLVPFSNQTV
jgi:hypothetical protein